MIYRWVYNTGRSKMYDGIVQRTGGGDEEQ